MEVKYLVHGRNIEGNDRAVVPIIGPTDRSNTRPTQKQQSVEIIYGSEVYKVDLMVD